MNSLDVIIRATKNGDIKWCGSKALLYTESGVVTVIRHVGDTQFHISDSRVGGQFSSRKLLNAMRKSRARTEAARTSVLLEKAARVLDKGKVEV